MKVKESMFEKLCEVDALEAQGYIEEINKDTVAETMGCMARFPNENEVFCDLDTPEQLDIFNTRYEFMRDILDEYTFTVEFLTSRNGNTHAVVTVFPAITDEVRLMMQSMLGSDPKREILGLMRYLRHGDAHDCIFRPL